MVSSPGKLYIRVGLKVVYTYQLWYEILGVLAKITYAPARQWNLYLTGHGVRYKNWGVIRDTMDILALGVLR